MKKLVLNKEIDLKQLGTLVAYKRHALKLTKEQLATKVGCDLDTIVQLEQGTLAFDYSLVAKVFDALGIEIFVSVKRFSEINGEDIPFLLIVGVISVVIFITVIIGVASLWS